MYIITKDATIAPAGPDDAFPGSFEVILSAPTEDRDGETLLPEDWKQPLPDKITFDADHGMSVATTIGSGVPSIDKDTGNLIVSGTYSSLQRAQDVRTLVNEGHITHTSVAYLTDKGQQRELLNGAIVAVPSNREAKILASKATGAKLGARNNSKDVEHIQGIHDHAAALGADCAPSKSLGRKDADNEDKTDPAALISAVDAAIDEAIDLFAEVDPESLPAPVQQAIALIQAADASVDELLDALGIPDPDEDAAASGAPSAPASGALQSAPVAGAKDAPVAEPDSDALLALAREIQKAPFI